ncbi:hypothetical protein PLICRDRAFT_27609 [Plicaturopsis crispa FD-325 SS-3]|nr:hypothetical protein PLICRDRAFT_27609 [Plicaturopsis crispa FD-325 SS-3]
MTLHQPNSGWPSFYTQMDDCNTKHFPITWTDYPRHDAAVEIPSWAYVNVTSAMTFDVQAAVTLTARHWLDGDKWTKMQKLAPVIVGISLTALFGLVCGFSYHLYRRRHVRHSRSSASIRSHRFLGLFAPRRRARARGSFTVWAIDEFDGGAVKSPSDTRSSRGRHQRLNSAPYSGAQEARVESFSSRVWNSLRNAVTIPWKNRPVPVTSLPPRKGFRIDDRDLSTQSGHSPRRETFEFETMTIDMQSYMGDRRPGAVAGLPQQSSSHVGNHDAGDDETSVLLISQNPGVDFSLKSSPTRAQSTRTQSTRNGVHVIPPSPSHTPPPIPPLPNPHSDGATLDVPVHGPINVQLVPDSPSSQTYTHSRQVSAESLARPARGDPVMLFPASVRGAGYGGRTSPYRTLSPNRHPSMDSLYTHDPMSPPGMT